MRKLIGDKKGNVELMYGLLTMGIVLLGLFIVFGIVGSGILQSAQSSMNVTPADPANASATALSAWYIRTNASSNLISSQSTVNMTAMVILFGVMIGSLLGYIYLRTQ